MSSGLISALYVQAGAINAFEQAISVTSANVANASTPGYATQTQTLQSMAQDLATGLPGGVTAGPVISSRNEYAQQNVYNQQTDLGAATQSTDSLTNLQSLLSVTGNGGISTALGTLYQSFSAWAQTPNDETARQAVLTAAGGVSSAINQAASGLASAATTAQSQMQQTVSQVNTLLGQLQKLNVASAADNGKDVGVDAQIYSAVQNLSQYVPVTATKQSDGTYTVMLAGQIPLVIGDHQYPLTTKMYVPADATVSRPPYWSLLPTCVSYVAAIHASASAASSRRECLRRSFSAR